VLTVAVVLGACAGSTAFAATDLSFPRPTSIESNIQFWVDVFTGYTERDFVIHDRDHLWRVYQVMNLPGEGPPTKTEVTAVNDYLKTKYSTILNRLASGSRPASYEERQVQALFKGEPPSAYAAAAQNLRVQQGMRERFRESLLRSRYYRPSMERIFVEAGVPRELVALALVESGFYGLARSRAGAVGIWQFTRGTGKQFMRITRYHDDRFDPIAATEAAAKLLRSNYLTFRSWPLAITAYNYGTAGTTQAAEIYNNDYARIVDKYDGLHFGFASKNYYAEFLAACQVYQYEDKYFPDLKYLEAPPPPIVRTDFAPRRIPGHRHALRRALLHRTHHTRHRHREIASSHRRRLSRSRRSIARAHSVRHGRKHHADQIASDAARRGDS